MEINLLGINGSHRPDKNTRYLIEETLKEAVRVAKDIPIQTEILNLSELNLKFCNACYRCNNEMCSIEDDVANVFEKMKTSDGIIMGSPVYLYNVSARLKTLMDRSRILIFNAKEPMALKGKVGGAVAVSFVRSAGSESTIQTITNWFQAQQMILAGNAIGLSGMKGGVTNDEAGKMFTKMLGKKIIDLIKKLKFSDISKEIDKDKTIFDKIHSKIY